MTQRQLDAITERLLLLLDSRVEDFMAAMPGIEQKAFDKVAEILKDLDIDARGRIKPSVKNVRLITKVKTEITNIIVNDPKYAKELDKLIGAYDEIDDLQQRYFQGLVGKFSLPAVLGEVKKQSVESVVEQMSKQGVGVNVSNEIRDVLTRNITTGGTYNNLLKQVRTALISKETSEGALSRYAKTVTTDSLNQYSRQYTKTLSQDLGLEWFKYVGSLRKTSRPFCRAMIEAKQDCMPYVHQSQFSTLLDGVICGEQTPISKKTGLPVGMIPGTNESNLDVLAGGYGCNHAFVPVSAAIVPKELRDKFE